MTLLRAVVRFTADLAAFAFRSGRWWLAALVLGSIVLVALASASKAVLPTFVYTVF